MDRIRIRLVTLTAASIIAAMALMLFYWIVTSTLEDWETIVAAGCVALLLGGIILLARRGRIDLSAGLLVGLVFFLIAADCYGYGLGTASIATFVLPILLAAFLLKPWACYAITGASIAAVWLIGIGTTLGWYISWIPPQESDLSFTAPLYTLLFLLVAILSAEWSRSMSRLGVSENS